MRWPRWKEWAALGSFCGLLWFGSLFMPKAWAQQVGVDRVPWVGAYATQGSNVSFGTGTFSDGITFTDTTDGTEHITGGTIAGSNRLILDSPVGNMFFQIGNATQWSVGSSAFAPSADNAEDLCASGTRCKDGFFAGTVTGSMGSGATASVIVGGSLSVSSTAVGNVGAGEDDLQTYTLPASSLTTTGRGIKYRASGTLANNANAKTLKLYFGASTVMNQSVTASITGAWFADVTVVRTGASTQRYVAELRVVNTATAAITQYHSAQGTLAITETGTIAIKATGTATTDNDIVNNLSTVEAL